MSYESSEEITPEFLEDTYHSSSTDEGEDKFVSNIFSHLPQEIKEHILTYEGILMSERNVNMATNKAFSRFSRSAYLILSSDDLEEFHESMYEFRSNVEVKISVRMGPRLREILMDIVQRFDAVNISVGDYKYPEQEKINSVELLINSKGNFSYISLSGENIAIKSSGNTRYIDVIRTPEREFFLPKHLRFKSKLSSYLKSINVEAYRCRTKADAEFLSLPVCVGGIPIEGIVEYHGSSHDIDLLTEGPYPILSAKRAYVSLPDAPTAERLFPKAKIIVTDLQKIRDIVKDYYEIINSNLSAKRLNLVFEPFIEEVLDEYGEFFEEGFGKYIDDPDIEDGMSKIVRLYE